MSVIRISILAILIIVAVDLLMILIGMQKRNDPKHSNAIFSTGMEKPFEWQPPDTSRLPSTLDGDLIRYGRRLVSNTAYYLGPRGKIAAITNGMNCQNCHLEAGTKSWGNNYSAVYSTYPRFRERSGTVENINKRINDCVERSLNGQKLDTNGKELKAIAAYINWVGNQVPKDVKPAGSGIRNIKYLQRPADPVQGKSVYVQQCQRCHGENGKGRLFNDGISYEYPPLWGENSYNTGAGLFRLSRLAGYVKDNMPFGISYKNPVLTDEEAWDVAAFVNDQPRPQKRFKQDWPNIAGKPVDHPFGPFADGFSEDQHKYGPFIPIEDFRKKK